MAEPKPLRMCLVVQLLGGLALSLWWVSLTGQERLAYLVTIWTHEQVAQPPPTAMLAQVDWLWTHRLARLQGVLGLAGLTLFIGMAEGVARRRRDALGGYRLGVWTCGLLALALLPGLVVACLLGPVPQPLVLQAGVLAAVSGGTGWMVATGRPQIR